MTQGVPGHAGEIRSQERRLIHPGIKVMVIHVSLRVLTWKYPDGGVARDQAAQEHLRLVDQMNVLHVPRLGMGEGDQAPVQIDIGPSQGELLRLSQARENRQPDPGVIRLTDCLAQLRLLLKGKKACSPCSYRGKLDAGKGAFLNHPSPDRPSEYMPEKLQVMEDGLRCFTRRGKLCHRLVKQGRGHGVEGLPCQPVGPPLPVILLNGDGRGLLTTGGEREEVACNYRRGGFFSTMPIAFREEAALLLLLLRLLVKVSRFRFILKCAETPLLSVIVKVLYRDFRIGVSFRSSRARM